MSSEDDHSDKNDDDEEVAIPPPPSPPPARRRGAIPRASLGRRGSGRNDVPRPATTAPSPSSSQSPSQSPSSAPVPPRRYTAADIDREIAAYEEEEEEEEGGRDDENEDDDDDDEEEDEDGGRKKGAMMMASRKSSSPRGRRTGYKRPRAKGPAARGKQPAGGKKKSMPVGKRGGRRMGDGESSGGGHGSSSEEWNDSDGGRSSGDDESAGRDDDDDDSDSDFGARPTRRNGRTRGVVAGRAASVPKSRAARATPARRRATRSAAARLDESFHEDDDDDDEVQYDTTPSGSRRPRRECKARTIQRMSDVVSKDMQSEREALGEMLEDDDKERLENSDGDDDDDDDDDDGGGGPGRTGVVARGVKSKKGGVQRDSRTRQRKTLLEDDDDEDYDEDAPSDASNDSDDDDEDAVGEDGDEDDIVVSKRRSGRSRMRSEGPSYIDVDEDEEEIGTADEDSDDEDTAPSVLMSPARKSSNAFGGSPGSGARATRARMGRAPLDIREKNDRRGKSKNAGHELRGDADGNDDDSDDDEDDDTRFRAPVSKSPTKLRTTHVNCPSTTDNITMAPLPKNKPHVCYIAPDGRTRHCFTLDTLYRIAISAKDNANSGSSSLLGGGPSSKTLQFLQPPHFRAPMEDDLLDQIASRFGRAALVIEKSPIYKKMKVPRGSTYLLADELDEFDEEGEYVGSHAASFRERFERYMQSLMGSADIYCCPLCFNEADRRRGTADEDMLEDDDDDDDDGLKDDDGGEDRFSFMDDPLTILGSLDQEEFVVASSFCFRYLADVKAHLSAVHGVNLKDIVGNDLFKRFQIRAGDGLLQSWLKRSLRRAAVQGDMMHYWLNGENQSFILLLNQIDRSKARGEHSGEYGSDFSFSFPNRARKIWSDVSAPYSKQHDMGDFIAEEGDDESEKGSDFAADLPVNPNFTPSDSKEVGNFKSPEEQLIEHLRKKSRIKRKYDSSNDDSSETNNDKDSGDGDCASSDDDEPEGSDDDELEVLPKPPQYEEEEEDDDWIKAKLLKAKKVKHGLKTNEDGDSDDDDVFQSNSETDHPKTKINGSTRKKVIDDDDSSLSSDGERKPKPKMHTDGGSARKRVIESSDEESF